VFSGTAALGLIWPERRTWASWFWISSIPSLAIIAEILQAILSHEIKSILGVRIGSFDVTDLILLALCGSLGALLSTIPFNEDDE
jgi:hypothetical protein